VEVDRGMGCSLAILIFARTWGDETIWPIGAGEVKVVTMVVECCDVRGFCRGLVEVCLRMYCALTSPSRSLQTSRIASFGKM
jgi:hypothetical protein